MPDSPDYAEGFQRVTQELSARSTEIRRRVVSCLLLVVLASAVGYSLVPVALRSLLRGMPTVIFLTPAEALNAKISLALTIGVVLAVPMLLWQLMQIIAPYLPEEYRRLGFRLIPVAVFLFFAGIFFSYVGVYPFTMNFFLKFHPPGLNPTLTIESVINFALALFIPAGLVFEAPLVIYFLARAGIVKPGHLTKNWKITFFILFVIASAITPSPELVSTFAMFIPLCLMWLGSILVVNRVWQAKAAKQAGLAAASRE